MWICEEHYAMLIYVQKWSKSDVPFKIREVEDIREIEDIRT